MRSLGGRLTVYRYVRCVLLVIMGIYVPSAARAQVILIDDAAIRRGYDTARYCSDIDDLGVRRACHQRAEHSIEGDRFAMLGFFYYSFATEAGGIANLRRDKEDDPRVVGKAMEELAAETKADLKRLLSLQDETFLSIDRICAITRTNCAMAERLYREWVPRIQP